MNTDMGDQGQGSGNPSLLFIIRAMYLYMYALCSMDIPTTITY